MNVFYKTFLAGFAMFAAVATNATADMYHASLVQAHVGFWTWSKDVEKLKLLGVTADSCEIWGKQKDSEKGDYFYLTIDGEEYHVAKNVISANTEYTLEDPGFLSTLWQREIPSTAGTHAYMVKVKGKNSSENKFVIYERNTDYNPESWWITGGKTYINSVSVPVYHSDTDTWTTQIDWDYDGIRPGIVWQCCAYITYDEGESWEVINATNVQEKNGISKTLNITIPGDKTSVAFAIALEPYEEYQMVVPNGAWTDTWKIVYGLNKPIISPDQGGSGSGSGGDLIDGGGGATGIDEVSNTTTTLVDVYNLAGECVAHNISLKKAAATLKHDVYVVNNKKMVLGK